MLSFPPSFQEQASRHTMTIQITRDRHGAHVKDGQILLSRVLNRPGATDTLFDVLAAAVSCLSKGPRVAVLGFGAGGFLAPLRAMGCGCKIEGVDLWEEGERLFRELSDDWAGPVEFSCREAGSWLKNRRGAYDLVLEDLSEPHPELGACKPWASFEELPAVIRGRLRPDGAALFNLLPWPGTSWKAILSTVSRPWAEARVIEFSDYENRLLLAGNSLESAAGLSRKISKALESIDSSLRGSCRLRTFKQDGQQ